jgi:butyrate kinase
MLEEYCGWIAPITCYPGEFEMQAMTDAALRVLRKEEELKEYSGKPVFAGFPFDQK